MPTLKLVVAAIFGLIALAFLRDRAALVVALGAAAILTYQGLRDLFVPVRLAADGTGLTVARGWGTKHVDWAEVSRIRVDERRRLGLRSQLLEIDVETTIYLFSSWELGAPVEQVAEDLSTHRTGR